MSEPTGDAPMGELDLVVIQGETMREGALPIWTVYERPRDYPAGYVARMFTIGAEGAKATGHAMKCLELEPIREKLHRAGLVLIPREDADEREIIESWV
jgi:hypothetical protein